MLAQLYGDKLQEITVYPRNYKRCFSTERFWLPHQTKQKETNSITDDGKISERLSTSETNVESISDKEPQDDALKIAEPTNGDISASAKDLLTNEHRVYTKQTAKGLKE